MKRFILLHKIKYFQKIKILFLLLLLISFNQVFGQTTNDYRSNVTTGNWGSPGSWQRFDGTNWVAAASAPTSAANVITIRNDHTITVAANVTVDQVVVEDGGQVNLTSNVTLTIANGPGDDFIVNGTVYRTNGTVTTTGTLVFGDGGTYQHARNGNSIPTATWDTNSNCNITGITNTALTGLNQAFGNFTWNCTGHNVDQNFPNTGTMSINGDLKISSTGTGTRQLRLNQSSLSVKNYLHDGGIFNLSNSNNTTRTINVSGDFLHTGGTITETGGGSASGSFVFNGSYSAGTGMQTFTSGGTVLNTINFTINSGAYLQMADNDTKVTGDSFILSSGATLGITSQDGITSSGETGNIQTTNRSFNTGANYIYNGTSAQNTGNGLPAAVSNLIFDNSGGQITFNSARIITNNFTISSSTVANLGTFTHSAGDLKLGGQGTVSGSWGHSSSTAINKNDTYFAATTGIVNITTSQCVAVAAPSGITATPSEICSGTSTILSVTNPGTGFTTDWFTGSCSGTLVGTGNSLAVNPSSTTTYFARTRNTTTNCISVGCASITVVVKEPLPISVNIVSSPSGAVCKGTVVTFTATATNGGSNPTYQWKVNETNVGTNSNVYSYVPADGDVVSCILTSDADCVEGAATTPITYFSWNDDTKAVTDSDTGLDAISIGGGQIVTGGIGGTTALGPITVPKTDINLNLGNNSAFNTEGVDYSISYRRAESVGQFFTRGNSLFISGGSVYFVRYRIDDGAGSFTTVTSSNFNIAEDNSFHDYRFTYDPSDGYGRLFIDGSEVWTSSATPGKAMYWAGAGDLIVGANIDASGNLIPTFDNLSIKGISLKSATDEVTLTVNPLPVISTQPSPLTLCEGESGSFKVVTSASSPTYQWFYSIPAEPTNWLAIPNATGVIEGTTTDELQILVAAIAWTGYNVSCLITANGCETRTSAVLLTVNPLPNTGEIIPD
jgi:hypothetical protein